MINFKKVFYLTCTTVILFSFTFIQLKPKKTIWLCGDSTISIKETKNFPETGWGMPFVYFWDSSIQVKNLANG